ncbi:hypothetical protein GGR50DRAFT_34806 [Xylaria sp. CBS 124048]|nr:hypothetical protein GGR50DRAFT_34806 [Xylaria sp. CBS 124048]
MTVGTGTPETPHRECFGEPLLESHWTVKTSIRCEETKQSRRRSKAPTGSLFIQFYSFSFFFFFWHVYVSAYLCCLTQRLCCDFYRSVSYRDTPVYFETCHVTVHRTGSLGKPPTTTSFEPCHNMSIMYPGCADVWVGGRPDFINSSTYVKWPCCQTRSRHETRGSTWLEY